MLHDVQSSTETDACTKVKGRLSWRNEFVMWVMTAGAGWRQVAQPACKRTTGSRNAEQKRLEIQA